MELTLLSEEEAALVMARKYIAAMRAYRERTGLGLREAKEAVENQAGGPLNGRGLTIAKLRAVEVTLRRFRPDLSLRLEEITLELAQAEAE